MEAIITSISGFFNEAFGFAYIEILVTLGVTLIFSLLQNSILPRRSYWNYCACKPPYDKGNPHFECRTVRNDCRKKRRSVGGWMACSNQMILITRLMFGISFLLMIFMPALFKENQSSTLIFSGSGIAIYIVIGCFFRQVLLKNYDNEESDTHNHELTTSSQPDLLIIQQYVPIRIMVTNASHVLSFLLLAIAIGAFLLFK